MIRPFRVVAVGLAAVLMAACGRESPTAVGGSLLTGGGARTFEILLDAPQFLVSDSAVSGFVLNAAVAPFHIVARSFGGVVNAHALATFVAPTKSITVLDSTNTSRTDTLPSFFQALVVLHVDTAAANGGPVTLQLFLDEACRVWNCGRPYRLPLPLIYAAAALCEAFSAISGTRSWLTRDFITIGRASYWGDTERMRRELLPALKYRTLSDGVQTLA